jgi:hypothetical protein
MNEGVTDQRFPTDATPRLLRFMVNAKPCYALKWRDERTEHRREVNYVLREAATDEIRCLLVDGPLRIAGFPELVSVQSTGRTLERAGTEWELALTVWADGAADDEGMIRICPPETFRDRSEYLRDDLKRLIREYRAGMRECHSPSIVQPSMTPPVTPPVDPAAVQREFAPVFEAAKAVTEALRTMTTQSHETRRVIDENVVLRKANAATSAEFVEVVRQFVKELPHPLSIIFDLRWNRHLSQDRIVAELRRLKIQDCRTKQRVGELLKEIVARAQAKGYTLSERVTGLQPPGDERNGYDEATGGTARVSTRTAVDDLVEKEDQASEWASMHREEQLTTLAVYRKGSPEEQAIMRKHYGPEFARHLKAQAI